MINLSPNRNICCGLKKVVAKSRAQVYFEQQILVLLLVFHQTHNLACNKFARALANQPIRALHFFNPRQIFLLQIKLIMQGKKHETSTKTCNETMLRDKLRVFVSRISPPFLRVYEVGSRSPGRGIQIWIFHIYCGSITCAYGHGSLLYATDLFKKKIF